MSRSSLLFRHCRRVRIGIAAAENQIKDINGRKRYKTESHVIAHTVPIDQRRPPDQPDFVKKQNSQITEKACPEHYLANSFEGDVLDSHHHDKELQKGNAGARHLLDHHQIAEKDGSHRDCPRRQMHIRHNDFDQKEKETEIPDQFAQFRSEQGAEAAVIYISLQDPQNESCKSDQFIEPDPHIILGDPQPDGSAVK